MAGKHVTSPWTTKEKHVLHTDVFDSIMFHLLNSTLAGTDYVPWDDNARANDPILRCAHARLRVSDCACVKVLQAGSRR